jgi:Dolichyl-phosphate-mannose-protein mannosyltransferase
MVGAPGIRTQVAQPPLNSAVSLQRRIIVVGLAGALLFITGVTVYLAMNYTPYQQDESSHVGYALSLRQGDLPSISTPVPTAGGGDHLRIALSRPWPFSIPTIHVANNPPFVYLASLPLVELAIRADITDGSLLVLRFVDLIGAVATVGVAYLLGRELSGGNRFVGLVTAGLLSSVIAISVVSSVANLDGPSLFATTGVTWMTARFARTRALRDATVLGLACAAAAAVRPMSLVFAAAAGAMALFLGLRARGVSAFVPLALRLAAPTVLITGWFYAWNLHRFGSVAGPYELVEEQGVSGPSLFDLLTGPEVSVQPFAYLVTEVYGRSQWWEYHGLRHYLITAVAAGVVITAVVLASRSSRSLRPRHEEAQLSLAAWICSALLALVPIVLTAYHASHGGAGHARYLFPILPIVAAATALVASRINRWLAVAVVGAFAVAQITRIRAAGNIHDGALSITPPQLRHSPVGQPFLALSVAVAIAGAVALLVSLVGLAKKPATTEN